MLIVLLSFSESLATKCLSLNDEPWMVRPTLIDLNPVKLKYYSFMISLVKWSGSCNVLSPQMRVPKKAKGINVESRHWKAKFNSTTYNSTWLCGLLI